MDITTEYVLGNIHYTHTHTDCEFPTPKQGKNVPINIFSQKFSEVQANSVLTHSVYGISVNTIEGTPAPRIHWSGEL